MRTNLLAAAFAALLSLPAFAQVEVKISWPQAPPLVLVEPGIQIVPDYPDEVFFVDSWYWVRRENRWFRARDYRGGWAYVVSPPRALVRIPYGKYRQWKAERNWGAERAMLKEEFKRDERRERGGRHDDDRRVTAPPARPDTGRVVAAPPARVDEGKRVAAPPGRGKGKK
ncbi:MAG TPA: hypothetical protein VIG99_13995 [Myxococcaceae bacterium]|jgi:hypothetical protein